MPLLNDGTAVRRGGRAGAATAPARPADFDVAGHTVAEVLAAVDDGRVDVDVALAAERDGKGRTTLLDGLTDRSSTD